MQGDFRIAYTILPAKRRPDGLRQPLIYRYTLRSAMRESCAIALAARENAVALGPED